MVYLDDFEAWCAYVCFINVVERSLEATWENYCPEHRVVGIHMVLQEVSQYQRHLNRMARDIGLADDSIEHLATTLAYNINKFLQEKGLQRKPEVH